MKWSRGMLLARFKEYLAMGMEWRRAAKRAGYAERTIQKQGSRIRKLAGHELPKPSKSMIRVVEAKPRWFEKKREEQTLRAPDPKSTTDKPAPSTRFEPDRIFQHPELGEVVRTAAGGFIPTWAREEFGFHSLNLSSLPGPGDHSRGVWARLYSAQSALACSYSSRSNARDILGPPPSEIEQAIEEESLPHGTIRYAREGEDVAGDALTGRFGFARMGVQGT